MLLMSADPLRGQVGGVWALETESFLGPIGQSHLGLKKLEISRADYFVQGHINQRCIGSFMYKSPRVT
jgi:hypothetical protein